VPRYRVLLAEIPAVWSYLEVDATLPLPSMPPSRAYHDAVWEALEDPVEPTDALLRERFLLRSVGAEGDLLGRAAQVLDLGCGDGYFASRLLAVGAAVVALDVAAEAVRRARHRTPALDARRIEADAPLPLEDASFDVVWAGETIEHVADTGGWLSEVRRVLRPRGLLLLSTPDHGRLTRLRVALSERAFAERFDPRGDHLRFYTRRALVELLTDFGFAEVEVAGAGGVPGARRVLLGSARRTRF
jgi:SAM-dependent methyltransferase